MMPRWLASAALALLFAAGCGGNSTATPTPVATPTPACSNAAAAHRAYLVVQHGSGAIVQRCVGFDGQAMNGDDLMKQSGVPVQTQFFTGIGLAYCAIDNEPATFDKCFPSSGPTWSLYVSKAGAAFQAAQSGAGAISLSDKDALGWKYQVFSPSPNPPPLPTLK